MIPENLRDVIFRLVKKSKEKKVNWKHASGFLDNATAADDYIVNDSNFSINIYQNVESTNIHFSILNERGDPVVHFSETPSDTGYEILNELLEYAREKANNVDDLIENIKIKLDHSENFGNEK